MDEIGWCPGGVRYRAPNGANNQFELDTVIHVKMLQWSIKTIKFQFYIESEIGVWKVYTLSRDQTKDCAGCVKR